MLILVYSVQIDCVYYLYLSIMIVAGSSSASIYKFLCTNLSGLASYHNRRRMVSVGGVQDIGPIWQTVSGRAVEIVSFVCLRYVL